MGYEVTNFTVDNGSTSEIEQTILDNYEIIQSAQDAVESLGEKIKDIKETEFDICNLQDLIGKVTDLQQEIQSITGAVAAIKILKGMERFFSFQIVLKSAEILTLRLKEMKINLEIYLAELSKKSLIRTTQGATTPVSAALTAIFAGLQIVANIISKAIEAIDVIITLISSITMFSLDGNSMAFFLTPKSLNKTAMNILNTNQSCNKFTDSITDTAIQTAETAMENANAAKKKAEIVTKSTAGAAAATDLSATGFDIGEFSKLDVLDSEAVKNAIKSILQLCIVPESLPRYEELSITNLRFVLFLMTGFLPAGKQSFGIPGMP